jgi:replicative DNA helicase
MVQKNPNSLPPHCPEAERGVLGCCLLDASKVAVALKAGVNRRWFYETRHADLFTVLASMSVNGATATPNGNMAATTSTG